MPNFRRYYIPNALVFITSVSDRRAPFLAGDQNIQIFWETLRAVQALHPFHLLAYVFLPDHFHWIMQMPEDQPNFSVVMHSIKRNYTWNFKKAHSIEGAFSLWQSRFWDHIIRDDRDLENHIHYIHWNPVKHNFVQQPNQWPHSSFRFWLEKGYYDDRENPGWGNLAVEDVG